MTKQEIKKEIDNKYALIETLLTPSHFELNPAVQQLYIDIGRLQEKCEHEYDERACMCLWCYKERESK